jgi:glycerol-3-phosphate dehydrogenase (NAD(P)+)
MSVVTVFGAGMMGSALSVALLDRGHSVRLVGTHLDTEIIDSLRDNGRHPTLKVAMPFAVRPYYNHELEQALQGTELVALGVSSAGVRWAAEQLTAYVRPEMPIVMVAKGLCWESGELRILPDVFRDTLPVAVRAAIEPVAIAGPCIAGELARRVPTSVVLTGRNHLTVNQAAAELSGPYYHVFVSPDAVGVEACAALKNAYAMAIAFGAGLHEKNGGQPGSVAMHNYEAAVFAQATFEMQQIVEMLGGDPRSVVWLPGVGDLDVTCNGGRTGRFGHLLGLGVGVAEAKQRMAGATLECLDILAVLRLALPTLEAEGKLEPSSLPLLRHMLEVALDDAPVQVPFERFFNSWSLSH